MITGATLVQTHVGPVYSKCMASIFNVNNDIKEPMRLVYIQFIILVDYVLGG